MLFASILDAGLIPFFVFAAMVSRTEYTSGAYGWDTLFESPEVTHKIVYTTFLVNIANGGLHLVSLVISIYLAVIFRQITRLPPDMNPLEDNLTARPHKRNKSEMTDKHLSQSSIDSSEVNRYSAAEDPLIAPTRTIPFMHTRTGSAANVTPQRSPQGADSKRSSRMSTQSHRFSRSDLPSQQQRIYEQANQSNTSLSRATAQKSRPSSRPTSAYIASPPALEPSRPKSVAHDIREPSGASSLMKDNWFTYPSSPSPPPPNRYGISNAPDLSPSPTRPTTADYNAAYNDLNNWSAYNRDDDEPVKLAPKNRGNYTALGYGNEENDDDVFQIHDPRGNNLYDTERDLGEPNMEYLAAPDNANRLPSPVDPVDPLGMNPPTPQPDETLNAVIGIKNLPRPALADLPNPAVNGDHDVSGLDSHKDQFYGDLGGKGSLSTSQDDPVASVEPTPIPNYKSPKSKKVWRRRSGKSSAYESLKFSDDDEVDPPAISSLNVKRNSRARDGDRKGRVVSNSGVDLDTGLQLGSGSSTYGNYIAGLGVGRRRDVSGKVAEEGRGGTGLHESDSLTGSGRDEENTPKKNEIRAAGWARWRRL